MIKYNSYAVTISCDIREIVTVYPLVFDVNTNRLLYRFRILHFIPRFMKQKSLKKISLLSFILLAASAVTAAVLSSEPTDAKQANSVDNGTLISNSGHTPGAGGIRSCVTDAQQDVVFSCHLTDPDITFTGIESEFPGNATAGNSSLSQANFGHIGDTTSIIIN